MRVQNLARPVGESPLEPARPVRSRLWLWFVAVGLLQFAAWTAWFVIAARHPVASVPLERTAD